MSENQEVWSEKKLPKNIRQIGETDGQNRVYMEDYVYTYIRKELKKRSSQVVCGVLIGTWETKSTGRCYFIKSAMVMEGLLSAKESMVAGTPLWKKTRELAEYYFPGQDLIGWFLHSREEGFFDQTEMTCMHRNLYPEGESIFFLLQEEDARILFGTEDGLEASGGFYIYYEKNPDMQNYMLETGQTISEEGAIDDTAIVQYRTIMQERRNQKGNRQEKILRRACVGLAAAVVFLSVYTWQGQFASSRGVQTGNQKEETVEYLAVAASVSAEEETRLEERVADGIGETDAEPGTEPVIETGIETSFESLPAETASETPVGMEGTGESSVEAGIEVGVEAFSAMEKNGMHYYEVQNGDTLVNICLTFYGTTDMLPTLCQVNGISNPALIYNGQRIYLP